MRLQAFISIIVLSAWGTASRAQQGITNHGSLQLHGDGAAGIHANFHNSGSFENEEGLVGFYNDAGSLVISGTQTPVFYDVEFSAVKGIWLENPLRVENNANLIHGDIRTTRDGTAGDPQFDISSFYTGENQVSKVDGYASLLNKQEFTFPIGDDKRLRPLTIESQAINATAGAAYYPEDPGAPLSFPGGFNPESTAEPGLRISREEFWKLKADIPSRVTITWDLYSNTGGLAQYLSDLRVVGWNSETQAWEDLGNTRVEGGRDYGSLTSDVFIPSRYEVITFGGTSSISDSYRTIDLDNYYLSPNGDGHNETLVIDRTAEAPNNNLQIYNRYGLLVFQQDNYQGGFNGRSNVDMVVQRKSGLEPGIYFYIITFHDLRERHQGYFYLAD